VLVLDLVLDMVLDLVLDLALGSRNEEGERKGMGELGG